MLTDATNTSAGCSQQREQGKKVLKTFARRGKAPAAVQPVDDEEGGGAAPEVASAAGQAGPLSSNAGGFGDGEDGSSSGPPSGSSGNADDDLAWLAHGLNDRRASTVIPFPSLLAAANFLARRKGNGQKLRQERLAACLAELAAEFAAVDSYELAVENASPEPAKKPQPHKRRGKKADGHAKQQQQHADKGHGSLEALARGLGGLGLGVGLQQQPGQQPNQQQQRQRADVRDLPAAGATAEAAQEGHGDAEGGGGGGTAVASPVPSPSPAGNAGAHEAFGSPTSAAGAAGEAADDAAATAGGGDGTTAVGAGVSGSGHGSNGTSAPSYDEELLPRALLRESSAAACSSWHLTALQGAPTPGTHAQPPRAAADASTAATGSGSSPEGASAGPGQEQQQLGAWGGRRSTCSTRRGSSSSSSSSLLASDEDEDGGEGGSDAGSRGPDADAAAAPAACASGGAPAEPEPAAPPLERLLQLCGQQSCGGPPGLPTMEQLLRQHVPDLAKMAKIGEGSYGEAFRSGSSVFKIVPIEGEQDFNGGSQKRSGDMLAESLMCLSLSRLSEDAPGRTNRTDAFVATHFVAVCRGPYCKQLVRAWKQWDKRHGSENEPVEGLPPGQLFWLIGMADSGRDLEKVALAGFDQARSVLAQVAAALAVAEQELAFEHRDLHWGNILVRPAPASGPGSCARLRLAGRPLRLAGHGLLATIIDFTQSRLAAPDGTLAFCDMAQDPGVFEGPKGHVQFDTYRAMRQLVGGDWAGSHPATNCLWMSYLAEVLAQGTTVQLAAPHKRRLRDFRRRAVACGSCEELLGDELFEGLIADDDA